MSGRGPGCCVVTGVNWRRNCLFLSVTRPDPSTLIRYLLYPMSSSTRPVLSHFLDIFPAPCWFWMITLVPGCKGLRSLVLANHLSEALMNRLLSANSLVSLLFTQTLEGSNCPGLMGKKSRMGLPKTNWLGERLYLLSGVFRCCIRALSTLSQSGEPSDFVLSKSSLLPDLTAVSALRLLCGWYAELTWWFLTPQFCRNCFNWFDLN